MLSNGVIWVTGYSASGKTSVGRSVKEELKNKGYRVIFLDGDDLRQIFSHKWGYNREDRVELAKVYFRLSSHLASQETIVVIAAVAMYDEVRKWTKENIPRSLEIYLDVPRDERLRRDKLTKGIYGRNDNLEDDYDAASNPDMRIENYGNTSSTETAQKIVEFYLSKNLHQ